MDRIACFLHMEQAVPEKHIQSRVSCFVWQKLDISLCSKLDSLRKCDCNYLIIFVGTHQEPGIIPRAINVLFNSIHGKESLTCRFKPYMVSRVVRLDDKTVEQELSYKQQIMNWLQDNYNVSGRRVVKSAAEFCVIREIKKIAIVLEGSSL